MIIFLKLPFEFTSTLLFLRCCTGCRYSSLIKINHLFSLLGAFLAQIYWHLKKVTTVATGCVYISSDNRQILRRIIEKESTLQKVWNSSAEFQVSGGERSPQSWASDFAWRQQSG